MNQNRLEMFLPLLRKGLSCIPLLFAILIFEFIKVQITYRKPGNSDFLLNLLLFGQLVPCFLFAYISDKYYRMQALISCHCLGLACGALFYFLGMHTEALILIVLTFTPLSVARASILDNFSHHSYLKLLSLTFFAQQIPWGLFQQIISFPERELIVFTMLLIFINTVLIAVFFKDSKKDLHWHNVTVREALKRNRAPFIYTGIAFVLASLSMRIGWLYAEVFHMTERGIEVLDLALMVGTVITMCYRRLPHMSTLTFCYSIGFGIGIVVILGQYLNAVNAEHSIFNFISFGSVVEGMAFPFALDALISMFGPKNKAIGSAVTEMGTGIASFLAITALTLRSTYPEWIIHAMAIFFFAAMLLQMKAETKKFQQD
jgi:hypothetical protein